MRDRTKWLTGLVITAVLTLVGVNSNVLGASAKGAQAYLERRANNELKLAGETWARVTMDGQRAILDGVAPTEQSLALARGVVANAVGRGGVLLGGVTKVDSDGVVLRRTAASAYALVAELDAARVLLSGLGPDEAALSRLTTLAKALFPDRAVDNRMVVDPAAPNGQWADVAEAGLVGLSRLDAGRLSLVNVKATLEGRAATDADAAAARASLSHVEAPFTTLASIEPMGKPAPAPVDPTLAAAQPDLPFEPMDAPVEPDPGVASLPDAKVEDCQARFNEALGSGVVLFAVGSANPTPDGARLLDRLAEVAADCAQLSLAVEGHTDDTGSGDANQALSEARAIAVATRFVAAGVPPGRLSAQGFGAARPAESNDTAEGRRANRRIEIKVSR